MVASYRLSEIEAMYIATPVVSGRERGRSPGQELPEVGDDPEPASLAT